MNASASDFNFVCKLLSTVYTEHRLAEIRNRLSHGCNIAWESVIDIANNLLVTPALWSNLKAKGLNTLLEEGPRDYLCQLYKLNKRRNTHLRRQLFEAVGVLNSAGITPLLLKGACQLVQPIHRGIGTRLMTDLDILVRPELLFTAIEALKAAGYEEAEVSYDPKKLHHWTPLVRNGEYGAIELHKEALNRRVTHVLPIREIFNAAESKIWRPFFFTVPDPRHSDMPAPLPGV